MDGREKTITCSFEPGDLLVMNAGRWMFGGPKTISGGAFFEHGSTFIYLGSDPDDNIHTLLRGGNVYRCRSLITFTAIS